MGRLFGTDGARGVANRELTAELAMNIGRAAAMVLINDKAEHPTVLIGRDTRISGHMLEGALAAGLCSVGANVKILGVVPTPAVAYLVGKYKADAGIMISASHNPYEFNGIKIFSSQGTKLPDELENEIESIVLDGAKPYSLAYDDGMGKVTCLDCAADDYVEHVAQSAKADLSGMNIALDCSNGSSSRTAQKLFEKLGANVHMLFDKPNGININVNCGSTHIENLQSYVLENKLDCGLAFDGDADRCLAVDENGELVDGDYLIAIVAKDMKNRGVLKNNAVVGTVMTNMGFNRFCDENGMSFVSTKVGDRYVLEEMMKNGYNIGGEQSGHIILLDHATTGDGELSGAVLLGIMKRTGKPLGELSRIMQRMPQVLENVKVSAQGKLAFDGDEVIKAEIKRVSDTLGDRGRILVRVSGTEPLIRVMLEGEDYDEISRLAKQTAAVVRERLS